MLPRIFSPQHYLFLNFFKEKEPLSPSDTGASDLPDILIKLKKAWLHHQETDPDAASFTISCSREEAEQINNWSETIGLQRGCIAGLNGRMGVKARPQSNFTVFLGVGGEEDRKKFETVISALAAPKASTETQPSGRKTASQKWLSENGERLGKILSDPRIKFPRGNRKMGERMGGPFTTIISGQAPLLDELQSLLQTFPGAEASTPDMTQRILRILEPAISGYFDAGNFTRALLPGREMFLDLPYSLEETIHQAYLKSRANERSPDGLLR